MNNKKRLIKVPFIGKKFTFLFMGNIVYSFSQWAMLVVIARLGSPLLVGQYSYGLALTAPVILFLNLQLRNYQATDTNSDFHFNQYLNLRLLTLIVAYSIIIVILLLSSPSTELIFVVLFVGLAKVFESLSDIYYGLFQKHGRMHLISTSMMIKGILSLIVLAIVMAITHSIILGSLSIAICWFLLWLFYDLRNGNKLLRSLEELNQPQMKVRRLKNLKVLKTIALITLPLGVVSTLDSLNSNIPRYILQSHVGEEVLGYYAAISYFMIAGGTVVSAMLQATSPKIAEFYWKDLKRYKSTLRQLLVMSGVLGVIGVVIAFFLGEQILGLFYGKEYSVHNNVFIYIMVASGIWYIASCLSTALTASRFIKVQVPIYIVSCISVFISSLYLIPNYSMLGAAISVCIGMLVRTITTMIAVIYSLKKKRNHDVSALPIERSLS